MNASRLMEIMRKDESLFQGFGQVYLTTNYPGVVAKHGIITGSRRI